METHGLTSAEGWIISTDACESSHLAESAASRRVVAVTGTAEVAALSALIGACVLPVLTTWGGRTLGHPIPIGVTAFASPVAGIAAGVVGAVLATRAGGAAAWPALFVWATALTAAAVCDGVTQRVPTPLIRQGTVATALLLLLAAVLLTGWDRLGWAVLTAAASGVLLLLAERFAGVGRGDVRMAVLGGLGVGWVGIGVGNIALGLAALCVVTVAQVLVVLARGGNRHTAIPYAPALALGFLVAACTR